MTAILAFEVTSYKALALLVFCRHTCIQPASIILFILLVSHPITLLYSSNLSRSKYISLYKKRSISRSAVFKSYLRLIQYLITLQYFRKSIFGILLSYFILTLLSGMSYLSSTLFAFLFNALILLYLW